MVFLWQSIPLLDWVRLLSLGAIWVLQKPGKEMHLTQGRLLVSQIRQLEEG